MFDMMDSMFADTLGVDVDTYISKIESISEHRAELILGTLMSEDKGIVDKGRRIFNLI